VDDLLARQVPGQAAHRHRSRHASSCGSLYCGMIPLCLQLFERQFELLDLATQLLGRGAELHPPQPGDLAAQRVDEHVTGGERGIPRPTNSTRPVIRALV
jgi:hypothetical protein